MPKARNILDTEQFTVSTTPQITAYLDQLVLTGFYGKNYAEAAERLIADVLRGFVEAGKLRKLPDSNKRV
jgi:hypothetical protein